jgi:hypothetical protein
MICFLTTLRENDGARCKGMERADHHRDFGARTCGCCDRTNDGIPRPRVWWMGNISDARACDPCLTPVCCALLHTGFPPARCLLSHPPSLFVTIRSIVAHKSRHATLQMRDPRAMGARMMVSVSLFMLMNKLIRPSVGADVSRPAPIYRPSVVFTTSQLNC